MKFTLARDEGGMTVLPDHPEVREFLTLQYRQMVKAGRKTRFETLREPMYSLSNVRGQASLFTHQGFWQDLAKHLIAGGHQVSIQDVRQKVLHEPNYAAALIGLKWYQKDWIIDALKTGNSGLLGAPTRFGKSYGMTAIARAFPRAKIVVTAPGVDLCKQLHEHFKEVLPHREVKGVYTGSRNHKQSDDITICCVDSLHKMDANDTDILIIDEPHAVVSDKRMPLIAAFTRARKYGFGATLDGRFDQKDRLIVGLIGPIISNVTYKQAVEWEAISPLKVIMIKIPFSKDTLPGRFMDRDIVYKRLLTQSTRTAALVKKILDDTIPPDWQTMAFIKDEKQAEFCMEHSILPPGAVAIEKEEWAAKEPDRIAAWDAAEPERRAAWEKAEPKRRKEWEKAAKRVVEEGLKDENGDAVVPAPYTPEEYVPQPYSQEIFDTSAAIKSLCLGAAKTIAMAKRMSQKDRDAVTRGIVQGDIIRVLASNIYVQGLTFPDLRVVINLAGGGANTTAIQKPGRLLQIRPKKRYGVMVDFLFECRDQNLETRQNPPYRGIVGECWARHKAYEKIGYDIEFVEDSARAREIILGAYETDGEPSKSAVGDP